MWDDGIDRAIDEVAREMTTGEPHGELCARVMADITAPRSARLTSSRSIWLSAIAAPAIVLFAVVAYRAAQPSVRLKLDTTTAAAPRTSTPIAPAVRPADTSTARPQEPGPHEARVSPPRRVAIPPSPIDALAPPPLAMDSLAVD